MASLLGSARDNDDPSEHYFHTQNGKSPGDQITEAFAAYAII